MRLKKSIKPYASAPGELLAKSLPPAPKLVRHSDRTRGAFSVAFFTRMLFSCLVDADFLATEHFMAPGKSRLRPAVRYTPADLLDRLDSHLEQKQQGPNRDTLVNQQRREVLEACRKKAKLSPGIFSLNVPTGGGKTLSSLAFALTHAMEYDLRRVVYAIPFTSIIEQTADAFREALGDLAGEVLEYHSNIDIDDPEKQTTRSRLAAENFDASLVVTTNLQLFESLFASRTSRCRKLHRLARSVIILDEVQTIPPNLLSPTLAALDELARNYGTTVVLCTATQPAITKRDSFPIGLVGVVPIISDSDLLHRSLLRTKIEWVQQLDDQGLVEMIKNEPQVLCIVNSRRHAAGLYGLLGDAEAIHLSASMCAAHRTGAVAEIRRRLKVGDECRVVSTQVIEAGVDVDFPAVFRGTAGLDSVAQAAGRCNREGTLRDEDGQPCPGRVMVFDYDEEAHRPPPLVRQAAAHFREVRPDYSDDLLAPDAVAAFFRLHYWQRGGDDGSGWDRGHQKKSVMRCFGGEDGNPLHHQFRSGAETYRFIDNAQAQVLVPYDRGRKLIEQLSDLPDQPDPGHLRSMDKSAQRYTVGVWEHDLRRLLNDLTVFKVHDRYYLANEAAYDKKLGLIAGAGGIEPRLLMP